MLGLRDKLVLGFSSMLALLLVTGGMGLVLLAHFSNTVDRVFHENYDSVVYGESMKDAVDGIDAILVANDPDRVRSHDISQKIADFETNLTQESRNITVPGEREAVEALTRSWQRYRSDVATCQDHHMISLPRGEFYRSQVLPEAHLVTACAQHVIDLNLQSIISANGHIHLSAQSARMTMYALLSAGFILVLVLLVLFIRSILIPLRTLTVSVHEIERGNLDLVVPMTTHDEVGILASAFNAMAGKLRETRRADGQKIMRAQQTTKQALDSLPDAVAIMSVDGTIDVANETAQRLFRLRPGGSLSSITTPQLAELHRQVIASAKPLHPKAFEAVIQIFDSDERFFLPHGLPILDADGTVVGVTLVLADITGLRRLDEMKSNLLAVVSHELRTPLTGLRMATHLLLDERTGPLSPKQLDLLLAARDESNRLFTIVEGLLDISQLQSGRVLMDLKPQSPRVLVDSAIKGVLSSFRDKGVTLSNDLPPSLPLVDVDAMRIDHVFSNLLVNALKYTPSGGTVSIAAQHEADHVEFRVQDSGPGVPPEHRDRIFERFYRIPGQTQAGAGLGLAIAREIVRAHGGQIWLRPADVTGSVFCFTVPLASAIPTPTTAPTNPSSDHIV